MTLIELLFVAFALAVGAVAASFAAQVWGVWAGLATFPVGVLMCVGAAHLVGELLAPERPRCTCDKCEPGDYVVNGNDIDDPITFVFACGRAYRRDRRGKMRELKPDFDSTSDAFRPD